MSDAPSPSLQTIIHAPGLLTPEEAARFLRVSKSWLDKARVVGDGPRYCRIGRLVRYRRESLEAFAQRRERSNTSQAA